MNLTSNMKIILPVTETVLKKVRKHIDTPLLNLGRMQEIYLRRNNKLYSEPQIHQIKKIFKSVECKFLFTNFHLEQLWTLSVDSRWELLDALANSLDRLRWDDNQSNIGSIFLESFLFQAVSFLDVYMFYICLVMGIKDPGKMRVKKFFKLMRSTRGSTFKKKAIELKEYFERRVFAKGQWGKLLRSLRDKIAHRDRLWPSLDSNETLLDRVLLDWPTLQGKTYERFCQDIFNNMFEMLRKTSLVLFNMDWKSGLYKINL